MVGTEALLASRVFDVERLDLEVDGTPFSREVVRHRGAVAVLAYDGTSVILVRQWRAPLGGAIVEVPAGTRDVDGESPEATAARELEEEAGLRAGRLEPLCELWNSPGWSDQRTLVFLATELTTVARRPSGPEEEAIELVRLPLDDAVAALSTATWDATTAVALYALASRRRP
ncbi:MAG TPA: NUDIX hydrolase [Acidimicrobiales bacterium]|nr:NUDIX hydrolase [Acidimicrobiales bacterium]